MECGKGRSMNDVECMLTLAPLDNSENDKAAAHATTHHHQRTGAVKTTG